MKKLLLMAFALLTLTAAEAQKIDARLTQAVGQKSQRRAAGQVMDGKALTKHIGMTHAKDGSVETVSVQAYLQPGAECPTDRLEQMGITVRYVVDDVAVLTVPADKLNELEQVDEIRFAKADALLHFDNDIQREATQAVTLATQSAAQGAGLPQAYTGKVLYWVSLMAALTSTISPSKTHRATAV